MAKQFISVRSLRVTNGVVMLSRPLVRLGSGDTGVLTTFTRATVFDFWVPIATGIISVAPGLAMGKTLAGVGSLVFGGERLIRPEARDPRNFENLVYTYTPLVLGTLLLLSPGPEKQA